MNFGSKDDFSELILKRKDGAVCTIALTRLEGHSISIGREGNRTVLRIELRADMSHVRYQGEDYRGPRQIVEALEAQHGPNWTLADAKREMEKDYEPLQLTGDAPPSTEKT